MQGTAVPNCFPYGEVTAFSINNVVDKTEGNHSAFVESYVCCTGVLRNRIQTAGAERSEKMRVIITDVLRERELNIKHVRMRQEYTTLYFVTYISNGGHNVNIILKLNANNYVSVLMVSIIFINTLPHYDFQFQVLFYSVRRSVSVRARVKLPILLLQHLQGKGWSKRPNDIHRLIKRCE